MMENHLVTGNSQCIVVFVFFLIGSSDSCIWFLEEGSCKGEQGVRLDANVADNIMKAADEVKNIGLTLQPLRGTNIKFLLTMSHLNYTSR